MSWPTLTVSQAGQKKIKEAIAHMGWRVTAEDTRPIVAASQHLIDRYAEANGLDEKDPRWLLQFEQIFRLEKRKNQPKDATKAEEIERINHVKLKIGQNRQTTYFKSLKHLIDKGELYIQGISYGNWSKFASQTKRNSINSRAFQAYCQILELDWKEIAEPSYDRDSDCCLDGNIPNGDYNELKEIEPKVCHLLKKLSAEPKFVEKNRNRQISQLLLLVEKHGGKDWKEWQNYQQLEAQWSVLCETIEWCIHEDRYNDVKLFWQYVKCYSYIQGYQGDRQTSWQNRLDWTEWLITTAKKYQDWSMVAQGLFDQAWTLTLMGKPADFAQAYQRFQEAKTLQQHTSLVFQIDLGIHFAFLLLRQQQYPAAQESLQQAKTLLTSHHLEPQISHRSLLHLDYYQGQISFYTHDYQRAKDYFYQALDRANQLNWQRAIALCKSWLGNTAVAQGDLEAAEPLLQECLEIAQKNQDNSRMAFCYQSLAYLFKAKGDFVQAKATANQAISLFKQLGLFREARVTEKDICFL